MFFLLSYEVIKTGEQPCDPREGNGIGEKGQIPEPEIQVYCIKYSAGNFVVEESNYPEGNIFVVVDVSDETETQVER